MSWTLTWPGGSQAGDARSHVSAAPLKVVLTWQAPESAGRSPSIPAASSSTAESRKRSRSYERPSKTTHQPNLTWPSLSWLSSTTATSTSQTPTQNGSTTRENCSSTTNSTVTLRSGRILSSPASCLDWQPRFVDQQKPETQPPSSAETGRVTASHIRELIVQVATISELVTLRYIEMLWEQRASIWRTTTESHQRSQTKFVPLWCLAPLKRAEVFNTLQAHVPWDASTSDTYWNTFLKTRHVLLSESDNAWAMRNVRDAIADHGMRKLLREKKNEAPPKFPVTLAPTEILEMEEQLLEADKACAAMALGLAYSTFQRFSDIAQLRADDVFLLSEDWMAICVRTGKVTKRIGAFMIHLPRQSKLATRLWQLACEMRTRRIEFLFPDVVKDDVRAALPPSKTLLAIRKGAAFHAALAGTPTPVLTQQLMHRDPVTTLTYTGKGMADVAKAAACAQAMTTLGITEGHEAVFGAER